MIHDCYSQVIGPPKGEMPTRHRRWRQANGYGYLAPYKDQYGNGATIMVRCVSQIRVPARGLRKKFAATGTGNG